VPLLLSEADVRRVLGMDDLIDAMERALTAFSSGAAVQPLRTVLEIGVERSYFGVMPAHLPSLGALGTKLVTVFERNHERGLPSHLATILLLDESTGGLEAVLDGRFITEARTAAVSAVSTRLLARRDASVLALLGSGVQASSHLEAISRVRRLREVRVWSPRADHREGFAARHADGPAPIAVAESVEAAVAGADLIVLATSSRTTVLRGEWVRDGTHICAVGACRPDQREMDTPLVRRARVYVDSRAGAVAEAGDLVLPMREGAISDAHLVGELGELAAGRCEGRRAAGDVTLFKSLGMAVEDVAAARLAYERAVAAGLGVRF
jgi:ornithine cyclodeaminase/alanine dehydrogenase-like protein (mu-crystallin family)